MPFLFRRSAADFVNYSRQKAGSPSTQILKSEAKVLDSAYIMTRCPDSIVGNLTPSEYYDQEDARECISSRGFDLQCREAVALRVIGQVRDLARGNFHEASDIDLGVGEFGERFHKAGRQPSSISPTSRLSRSATPTKSSLNWSGRRTPSSTRRWPKTSGSSGLFHLMLRVLMRGDLHQDPQDKVKHPARSSGTPHPSCAPSRSS